MMEKFAIVSTKEFMGKLQDFEHLLETLEAKLTMTVKIEKNNWERRMNQQMNAVEHSLNTVRQQMITINKKAI